LKNKLISALKFIILLTIGVLFLLFAFKGQNPSKLFNDLRTADYSWVALSLLVSLAGHWLRAVRWNMLINPLGYRPSSKHTFYAVMTGYLANLAFPRMGEISRCGALTRTDHIPLNALIGTVILERIVDVMILFLVLLLAGIMQFGLISDFLYEHLFSGIITRVENNTLLLTCLFTGFVLFIAVAFILFKRYKKWVYRSRFVAKSIELITGIRNGFITIRKINRPWLFIIYSIGIWFTYYLSTYLCFFAIKATSGLDAFAALFVLGIGGLGMSAPVQGGIGAYHFLVSEGLVLLSVPKADGLSFATITHSSQTLLVLVIGSLSLIRILSLRRKTEGHG
jgi:glycosyltransferase 2 family protein